MDDITSALELTSALEQWQAATPAAAKGAWNRWDGLWLVAKSRKAHIRFCFDGAVELELIEGDKSKVAPLPAVVEAVRIIDLFLRHGYPFADLPGDGWKALWFGAPVPAVVVDHPERITLAEIESQPDRSLRRMLIDVYGVKRYWQETIQNPTGPIRDLDHMASLINRWRKSAPCKAQVSRETVCEGDPRNEEELITVRSGTRQVTFGEPREWRDQSASVSVADGELRQWGHLSRREEVVRLLDLFLGHHCPWDKLPAHGWTDSRTTERIVYPLGRTPR